MESVPHRKAVLIVLQLHSLASGKDSCSGPRIHPFPLQVQFWNVLSTPSLCTPVLANLAGHIGGQRLRVPSFPRSCVATWHVT